jgi:hypothetical protein
LGCLSISEAVAAFTGDESLNHQDELDHSGLASTVIAFATSSVREITYPFDSSVTWQLIVIRVACPKSSTFSLAF